MSRLILLVGNTGTGKSLIARKLANMGKLVVSHDALYDMMNAGGDNRQDLAMKGALARSAACMLVRSALASKDVVIDAALPSPRSRAPYLQIADEMGVGVDFYLFHDPGKDICVTRRLKSDLGGLPRNAWESFYDNYQSEEVLPTDTDEHRRITSRILAMPKTFTSYAFNFDGVIYHNPRRIDHDVVEFIRTLYRDLHNLVLIWSTRSGETKRTMRHILLSHDIPFDSIGVNPVCELGSRKMYADRYYDTRFDVVGVKLAPASFVKDYDLR